MRSTLRGTCAVLLVLVGCSADVAPTDPPLTATASPTTTPARAPEATIAPTAAPEPLTAAALVDALDLDSMRPHLEELQRIADDNGGSRATGTAGFDASADYVRRELASVGWFVDRQELSAAGVPGANLLVERAGAGDDVVMLGAHLDSVAAGPGINDNGSGVAALLAIATQLRELPPQELTVRFAFWGAEEGGPFGSQAYVNGLEPDERDRITAYLNFDMIGSPNAIRLVYDEADAASGSDELTDLFADYFEDVGLAWEPIDLEGDSDHGPFIDAGIPTGGLFSGGIEPVTDAQATTFGATAGEPADPCSHRACDTLDNVNLATLEQMTDAIAHVLVVLVRS